VRENVSGHEVTRVHVVEEVAEPLHFFLLVHRGDLHGRIREDFVGTKIGHRTRTASATESDGLASIAISPDGPWRTISA